MALYSSTLIIKHKTNKSDAELLKSLNLHKKSTHSIGEENKSYNDALSADSKSVYITSTENHVIVVGMPLIMDFVHINRYSNLFPDCEFFFMFNESVSMLNGFVYGKGETIYRRKYIQNGAYFKTYDIDPDFGNPLPEEIEYYDFSKLKEKGSPQKVDYMQGIHDFDISLKFLKNNFIENPVEFFESLTFNRDISIALADYLKGFAEKVDKKDIDDHFRDRLKSFAKEFKFKKLNVKGADGKIPKDSFCREFTGTKLYIVCISQPLRIPNIYYISIELQSTNEGIKDLLNPYYFGIPIFSIKPNILIKTNEKSNDSIYTKSDLELVANDFENELNYLIKIISQLELNRPEDLFSDEYCYRYCIEKLSKNVRILGEIWNKDEINFCLLYYFYTKNTTKTRELIDLLDQVQNDKTKSNVYQTLPRAFIDKVSKNNEGTTPGLAKKGSSGFLGFFSRKKKSSR